MNNLGSLYPGGILIVWTSSSCGGATCATVARMKVITQHELQNDDGSILREVDETGETFLITSNGVPGAELRPVRNRPAFASLDAFLGDRQYGSSRSGRFAELRNDLAIEIDLEIEDEDEKYEVPISSDI